MTERSNGPSVYVGPDESKQWGPERVEEIRSAAGRGGATLTNPEEAEAVVWLGPPFGMPDVLHEGVRWVQLPSAGVESWFESGVLDTGRVYTSAVGAYAGQVAEHALALMLAGARRLQECARAESWTAIW